MNDKNNKNTDTYGEVLDINKIFAQTLKKKIKKIILGIILSLFWSFAFFFYLPKEFLVTNFGFILIFLSWLIYIVWLCMIYAEIRKAFWQQIALKYGWEYKYSKNILEEKALLFKMGHSGNVQNGIIGNYNNRPFHIFEYEYSVNYGKNQINYSFTVFEVKFTGTFPHLYLNYKNDWYSHTPSMFSTLANIPLPNEFEKMFKLYAPKEYEIETLEIFTPNIFALLLDLKWSYDMEFVDGELVIYTKKKFSDFKSLDEEITKIKKFIDIISGPLNRMKLTQIGDISPSL